MTSPILASPLDTIRAAQADRVHVSRNDLAEAIESLVATTAETYSRKSVEYADCRGQSTTDWEEHMTGLLLAAVRDGIAKHRIPRPTGARWRLLDVGAGHGRDLARLSVESDVLPVALENAPGFLALLEQTAKRTGLPSDSVVAGDMRDLSMFDTGSFHCVRNHATLHHLPVVAHGMGADLAVSEARRVLVPGGIFYVLVKAGAGAQMLDTHEGMGERFFQLFTRELLMDLLLRNRFTANLLEKRVSQRPAGDVEWWFCLASAA